jgi:hypothetical protein
MRIWLARIVAWLTGALILLLAHLFSWIQN